MKLTLPTSLAALALTTAPVMAEPPTQPEASPTPKAETDTGPHHLSARVYFKFDSTGLSPRARAELREAASWLQDNDERVLVIEGHADKVGDRGYNKELSEARGRAVELFLIKAGADPDRVQLLPYGEKAPVIATDDPARENRRVVLLASEEPSVTHDASGEVVADQRAKPRPDGPAMVRTEYVPVEQVKVVAPPRVGGVVPPSFSISAGGGVVQSLDESTREATSVGGTWNVRVALGNRSLISTELAYSGLAQGLDDSMALGEGAAVVGNGVHGALRINAPGLAVAPYAFAGAGYMRFSLVSSDVDRGDSTLYFPAGLGLAYRHDDLVFDLRATVRATIDEELLEPMTGPDSELDHWTATAQIGWELF